MSNYDNATRIMQAAIENGSERARELGAENGATGMVETTAGEVRANVVVADYLNSGGQRQWRTTWELKGKRIAKAKLVTFLNEQGSKLA